MQNYVHINSKLYTELFLEGGDNLVAVYCMLKFAKNGGIKIYKEQNRNIYHTLKEKTNLSVSTLRKYIKQLVKLNLCHFDTAGNFVLKGNNKLNKEYKGKKLVRIIIGSYSETKVYSFYIRVRNNHKLQVKRIDRRDEQNKINRKIKKNIPLTSKENRFFKSWRDADKEYAKNPHTFNAKTVMSNKGFSKLKNGITNTNGSYWKKKLVMAGLITTKREFKFLKECSKKEYLSFKYNIDKNVVFSKGKLYLETVPSFSVLK